MTIEESLELDGGSSGGLVPRSTYAMRARSGDSAGLQYVLSAGAPAFRSCSALPFGLTVQTCSGSPVANAILPLLSEAAQAGALATDITAAAAHSAAIPLPFTSCPSRRN